jgi:hypothetical protein
MAKALRKYKSYHITAKGAQQHHDFDTQGERHHQSKGQWAVELNGNPQLALGFVFF